MMTIQRTHRRLLILLTNRQGEIWDWSPRTADSSEWAIWSDFRFWMAQTVHLSPAITFQTEMFTDHDFQTKTQLEMQKMGVLNESDEVFKMRELIDRSKPGLPGDSLSRMPARVANGTAQSPPASVRYLADRIVFKNRAL